MTDKSEKMDAAQDDAAKLAEAQAQAEKYLDMARRLQADFDNYRKRTQRENEEFRKYACSGIVGDLLTVVDDLDRALEHAGEDTEFVKGIRGVRANLMKVLEANGLREIPADGRFDPDYHEAMMTVDGDEDGLIAEVFQKGYTLNGKVLRYSKVKVTRKTERAEGTENAQEAEEGEEKCQE